MAVGDLTTTANVKNWRTPVIANGADDAQLSREVSAASRAILQYIQRKSLAFAEYVETRNGSGTPGIMLKNYPVVSVGAVSVNGQAILPPNPISGGTGAGFVFSPDDGMLYLRGYIFESGFQNVTVSYAAGLLQLDEGLTVDPGTYRVPCSALSELWCSNAGVVDESGDVGFVPVKSNPSEGQYVPPGGPDGFYQFAAADGGATVDVSYGWTPKDVEEACIQLVILEYNRRSTVGQNSKVLTGENVNYYSSAAFTPTVKERLESYMNLVPNV